MAKRLKKPTPASPEIAQSINYVIQPRYTSNIIQPPKPLEAAVETVEESITDTIKAAHKTINGSKPDYDELTDIQLANILTKLEYEETFNKLTIFYPEYDTKLMNGDIIHSRYKYLKHLDFFSAAGLYPMTMFRAGNQTGKSTSMYYLAACHMTGIYPDWYTEEVHGFKFTKPPRVWFGAYSSDTLKKTVQKRMLGDNGQFGSGFIPRKLLDLDSIKDAKRADTPITTFRVKHSSGGYSTAALKTYEGGRRPWEAETVDLIVLDEEPSMEVLNEALARLIASKGRVLLGFTPNDGMTPVVDLLTDHGDLTEGPKLDGKLYVVTSTVNDVPHIGQSEIDLLVAGLPSQHMKDARLKGIPSVGQGMVYPIDVDSLLIDETEIPRNNMVYCMAIDFGWFHPTGVLHMGYNLETGIYYALLDYKVGQQPPEIHAQYIQLVDVQMKKNFHKICDPSKGSIDPKSGRHVANMYNDYELDFKDANNDVDSGIMKTLYAMQHGQLKIAKHCTELVRELRAYAYDKHGKIKKINDDLVDPLRYCMNEPIENWNDSYKKVDAAGEIAAKLYNSFNARKMF